MADSSQPNPKASQSNRSSRANSSFQGDDHTNLNQSDQQERETSTAPQTSGTTPRSPETEKGRQVRVQYLAYAQMVLRDTRLIYADLYQRHASNRFQVQQSAQALDQAIATLALKSGTHPRQVIQLLAQGPFTQHQTQNLSPEEKKLAIPKLLNYAQSTVETIQRQRFVEYANAVTGKSWSYPDLYREHVGSDLTAIQLDQKVTAAALQAGESPDAIAALLQQGPYARFQQDVKQVSADTIEQYARGTIAQVQEIQSLNPMQQERSQSRLEME
ncbi:MAG: hypothetical protein ACFE0I_22935 [Elainellaceae cyanobacterium]